MHYKKIKSKNNQVTAIKKSQQVSDLNPLDKRWSQMAATHDIQLASVSRELLQVQRPAPDAEDAMVTAVFKSAVETPMLRLVQPIEPLIARDTVFNLYAIQTKIDDWFASASVPASYDDLTNRIYADAFLMPLDDPWLGLSPDTFYTALDNGGRIDGTSRPDQNGVSVRRVAVPQFGPARLDSELPH